MADGLGAALLVVDYVQEIKVQINPEEISPWRNRGIGENKMERDKFKNKQTKKYFTTESTESTEKTKEREKNIKIDKPKIHLTTSILFFSFLRGSLCPLCSLW